MRNLKQSKPTLKIKKGNLKYISIEKVRSCETTDQGFNGLEKK